MVIPLTQLSLQHFRTHAQLSLNFDNQVTVISGPNASGK
ncbi:MAG: AAA family ATPase, partial [Candidatus Pacebacteria bacterium]|nr:AAA family ATPase [Candidatus Paceibacterota bacterium]